MERFADTTPTFDPLAFFTGHVVSWGVVETRGGAPSAVVTTDCAGEADGPDGLRMTQRLAVGGDPATVRVWHLRRRAAGRYEATANDMVGTTVGVAAGRAFHWTWVLATRPGVGWRNATFSQWMYLMDDGAVVNRTVVSKLGVTLAEVTEQFRHVP